MEQSEIHSHEAEYCQLQADYFSELAEQAANLSECSYYRELELIWRQRARSQLFHSVPGLRAG
ncbi:hypothetical protein IZ6_19890 [Terrihabitans soli]|uniref:Uncharacterized protein n=1 Tax=Terrihabitans soli TaxID=708113 RepID=A0A6S6QLH5_9HYPH|nr:hypothetical protein [Terrihabitans soli]BCJ91254.1 hypothetical protein IZ6_19890 [Terrihabitans soli]